MRSPVAASIHMSILKQSALASQRMEQHVSLKDLRVRSWERGENITASNIWRNWIKSSAFFTPSSLMWRTGSEQHNGTHLFERRVVLNTSLIGRKEIIWVSISSWKSLMVLVVFFLLLLFSFSMKCFCVEQSCEKDGDKP